jgi:hypothetical protein
MNLRSLEAQAERLCCVTEYSGEASAVGYDQLARREEEIEVAPAFRSELRLDCMENPERETRPRHVTPFHHTLEQTGLK